MINSMTDIASIAAYLGRIGAEPRSLRVAVVKEQQGPYWKDIATIRMNKDGSVDAPDDFAPTESEAAIIRQDILAADWPTSITLGPGYALPPELKAVDHDSLFMLNDPQGRLIMIQQRIDDRKTGDKAYIPWTMWSDNVWRKAEPEGALPLFGLDKVGDNTTVFIHEGAKAARFVHRLVNPSSPEEKSARDAHPWGRELSGAAHVGWIAGALSPARTDWSILAKMGVKRAYIVADNDGPGKAAIPAISMRLRGMTTFSVEFSELWPISFDLADPFPPKMFKKIGAAKNYTGPSFRDTLHPATWATDMIPNPSGKGKPIPVLRKEFSDLWVWIEETDMFMCKEHPEINHAMAQFNAMVGAFSHVTATGQMLHKNYKGRTAKMCYRPDITARMVTDRSTSAINLHSPTTIRPIDGDVQPWMDFLNYLLPIESERTQLMRWCATLIARPEVRMLYGVLLVSERQGMGKSTLGERILAPLVGMQNAGFPGERDIVESTFNGWVANKRLVVVGEIYTGQSFKAYNILKSYLTDKNINVNEKFQRPYTVENWTHILACSNSRKALRIEDTDRRWFYPKLNESPWSRAQWGTFFEWLGSGGLGIIMKWAQDFGDYVMTGEHAPMTDDKRALINESKGDVINNWIDIMSAVESESEKVVFALNDVREYMKCSHGKIYETALQFKKEALMRGWVTTDIRVNFEGAMSYVVASPEMANDIVGKDRAEAVACLKLNLKKIGDRHLDSSL